tara:strand:+ start:1631 stop:1894 length:264 start_codon:yes stop_codon:yes gene_type:complete
MSSFFASFFTNSSSKSLSVSLKLKLQCAKEIHQFKVAKSCVKTTESIPPEMAINSFFPLRKGKLVTIICDNFSSILDSKVHKLMALF